jgi:cation:H+ antiporter
MGIGNAIGSNITNVTLVLGASAVVGTLSVHSRLLVREIPLLFLSMAVSWWFLWDGELTQLEGLVLFGGLIALLAWLSVEGAKERGESPSEGLAEAADDDIPTSLPTSRAVALFLLGLVFLLVGSRVLVWGGVELALALGVSELVVGLTLVALGTSLPELAASVAASRRGEQDLAVGNVVGSNIFNLLGVLALPGIISPGRVSRLIVVRDFPLMLGATLLLLFMAVNEANTVGRKRGLTLILVFIVYFVLLFAQPTFARGPA